MKDIIKTEWKQNEEWKHYESYYYISNMGRVYSTYGNRLLKPSLDNSTGYYRIWIKGETIRIHRLVGRLFVPNDNLERNYIDHINNIKTDNRANNLQWLTNVENIKKSLNKEIIEIDLDGKEIGRWESATQCSRETGIRHQYISRVCRGVQKHVSNRIFKYVD